MSYSYIPNIQSFPYPYHGYGTDDIPTPPATTSSAGVAFTYNGIWTPAITPAGLAQEIDDPWSYNGSLLPVENNDQQDSIVGLASDSINSTISPYSHSEVQQAEDNNEHGTQRYEIAAIVESRRKDRNKAAQRAFRERRKQHLQDIETELHRLRKTAEALTAENQRLKGLLQKMRDVPKQTHLSVGTPHHWSHGPVVTSHQQAVQTEAATNCLAPQTSRQDMQPVQAHNMQHVPHVDYHLSKTKITGGQTYRKSETDDGTLSLKKFANAVLTLAVKDAGSGVSDSQSLLQDAEDERRCPSGLAIAGTEKNASTEDLVEQIRLRPKLAMRDRQTTQRDEQQETESSLAYMTHQVQRHAELLAAQRAITTAGLADYCTVLRL